MSDDLTMYARTRDPELRELLAVRHLPLVKFVARKMSRSLPSHIELDDLTSWGSIGLLDAIDKFDPTRQVKFSTYAVTRIRGAILDGLQKMDWAPKQVTSKVRAVRHVRTLLTSELGHVPSVDEMAERMAFSPALVRRWLLDDMTTRVQSLEPSADDDEGTGHAYTDTVYDEPDQEVAGEVAEIRAHVAMAMRSLGVRERAVLLLYYRDSMTLREIAEHLGVSVSSATQTHTRLINSVRHRLATLAGVA